MERYVGIRCRLVVILAERSSYLIGKADVDFRFASHGLRSVVPGRSPLRASRNVSGELGDVVYYSVVVAGERYLPFGSARVGACAVEHRLGEQGRLHHGWMWGRLRPCCRMRFAHLGEHAESRLVRPGRVSDGLRLDGTLDSDL